VLDSVDRVGGVVLSLIEEDSFCSFPSTSASFTEHIRFTVYLDVDHIFSDIL